LALHFINANSLGAIDFSSFQTIENQLTDNFDDFIDGQLEVGDEQDGDFDESSTPHTLYIYPEAEANKQDYFFEKDFNFEPALNPKHAFAQSQPRITAPLIIHRMIPVCTPPPELSFV